MIQRPSLRASTRLLAAALVISPLLAACAGGSGVKKDTRYVARDVNTLYRAAQDRLERRQYKIAAALFDEVERQHPYSIWARRAQLMSAFSYYMARQYQDSVLSAQRFLSLHPGNRDAPYAYYLIALSYYEQIASVQRDQSTTLQAQNALAEVVKRYPNTAYADDARLKLDLVNDHLSGKEMEVGRFYQARGDLIAATIRFRTVVEKFQTTSHVPEALHRLVECYLALGIPEEAEKTAAVLGYNFPGSPWYERTYKLIGDKAA